MKTSLDINDEMPRDMRRYLSNYGWHFNTKMLKYAVSLMKKYNPATGSMERIEPMTVDDVDDLLKSHGVTLEKNVLLDYVYVANMAKSDFWKSSIEDEQHMALYIKDVIDDKDAGDGTVMRRWVASMVANGDPIDWFVMV